MSIKYEATRQVLYEGRKVRTEATERGYFIPWRKTAVSGHTEETCLSKVKTTNCLEVSQIVNQIGPTSAQLISYQCNLPIKPSARFYLSSLSVVPPPITERFLHPRSFFVLFIGARTTFTSAKSLQIIVIIAAFDIRIVFLKMQVNSF